jgi:hypothetical protein
LRFLKPCPVRYGRSHVLARFDTHQISNGGAEAVNLIIEKTRRLPHGFTAFDHYRLRILLAASGLRPYRRPNHLFPKSPHSGPAGEPRPVPFGPPCVRPCHPLARATGTEGFSAAAHLSSVS